MLEVCHQQWEGFKQSAYYETVVTGYEELTYKGKSFLQSTGILFQFQEEKATHKVHDEHDTVGFTQRDHVFTGIISILNSL